MSKREVNGFEVVDGWTMPEAPAEGLVPYVAFHGGDGLSLFWWHPSWGRWASDGVAFEKVRELGVDDYIEDPLVRPDTGGHLYKDCMAAYAELGFGVV